MRTGWYRRLGPPAFLAAVALGLVSPMGGSAAHTWPTDAPTLPLDQLTQRLDRRADGAAPAFTMDTLALELQGQQLPAAALVPGLPDSGGFARRLGLFLTGMARWVGDTLWSDGLVAGADLGLPRGAVGVAASYMNAEGGDGVEAAGIALYGSRGMSDGARLHAVIGAGRSDAAEPGGADAPFGFSEVGVRWRTGLGAGFTLAPDLRLGAVAPGGDAPAVDGLAAMALDGAWDLPRGDLGLSAAATLQTSLTDGGRRAKGQPGARVRFGGRRPLRADLGLRLGITLTEQSGEVFSLELTNEDPDRPDGGHLIRMGWFARF